MGGLGTSGAIAVESCSLDVTVSCGRRRHEARVFTEKTINVCFDLVRRVVLIADSALVVASSILEILMAGFVNLHFVALVVVVKVSCCFTSDCDE